MADPPMDRDDWRMIGRALIYALLMVLGTLLLGVCVRLFLWAAFG